MSDPCASCPAADPCDGALCHLAGDPLWRAHVAGRAALQAARGATIREEIRRGFADARKARTCRHYSRPEPCKFGRCALPGRGDLHGNVTLADCRGCPSFGPTPPAGVLLHAYLRGGEGYGRISRALGVALEGIGVPARYLPALALDDASPPEPWTLERLVTPEAADAWPAALQLQVPQTRARPNQRKLAFTMTESTGLRPDQLEGLNEAELVLVPSHANAEWFRASGVRLPVRVAPLGLTDPGSFAPREGWQPSGPTRFGMAGRQVHGTRRKNLQGGIDAFLAAFDARQDVRLEVISTDSLPLDDRGDGRITIRRRPIPSAEMAGWYRGLDAFFSPSRGEGWSMHPHEAMACGVPVIACFWGGPVEFLDPATSYPVAYSLAPTGDAEWAGEWCEPDADSMVAQLRAVHADRDEAARRGRLASPRARAFTWEATARVVAGAMRELGMLA